MTRLPKIPRAVPPPLQPNIWPSSSFSWVGSPYICTKEKQGATRDRISHWIHLKKILSYFMYYICILLHSTFTDISFIFLKIQHLLFWTCLCWFHTRESRLTEYCLYIFNQLPYLFKYINRYISWTHYVWPWHITVNFMVKTQILRSMWFRNRKYNGYYYRIEV